MAVLGANSPEWFSCAVGAVMAGGVVSIIIGILFFVISNHHNYDDNGWSRLIWMSQVTGVYTTNTTEAVRYQLKHSMANIAVVDGRAQLEKVILIMMMMIVVIDDVNDNLTKLLPGKRL